MFLNENQVKTKQVHVVHERCNKEPHVHCGHLIAKEIIRCCVFTF